jgi:copper transport protein
VASKALARWLVASGLGGGLVLFLFAVAYGHAMLISSDPPAGGTVTRALTRVRLVFSEPLEASLSEIGVVDVQGRTRKLVVASDPRNVHALVAPVDALPDGAYRVVWRTVSADGHPVEGSFIFHVRVSAAAARAESDAAHPEPLPPDVPAEEALAWGPSLAGAPLIPAILRGAALGALMAAGGLLAFIGWPGGGGSGGGARVDSGRATRLAIVLAGAATLLLVAHLLAWLREATPGHSLDTDWTSRALGTGPGAMELWRIGLTLVALWAAALARRPRVAAVFALGALAVSGAIGHPAAIVPLASIPAKALHLIASALWLGGLFWLAVAGTPDHASFHREAQRVSSVALIAVIVVALSGAAQSFLFLPSVGALLTTAYGWLVLAKVAGMVILIAFGAHHRYRVLPALGGVNAPASSKYLVAGADGAEVLRRSVWREIGVMAIVIALGGLLAYVSPNVKEGATVATLSLKLEPGISWR